MRAERRALPTAARYASLVGVVTFVTVPVYVFVEPASRGVVVRLAAALVLGIALLDLRGALVLRLARDAPSALDAARARPPAAPAVAPRLVALVADVRAAVRSRRHFEHVLWPRLRALSRRAPPRPPARSVGRGPGLETLRDVVAAIEREP
jgi:hypothetical protein